MEGKYTGVVVIIPSRNRSKYAIRAINSALEQADKDVFVLVSDNSTKSTETQDLYNYCRKNRNRRLRYVAPEKPLAMSDHWDWVIQQALHFYEINHFLYLSDRNVFMSGALNQITRLAFRNPEKVISYNSNRINDLKVPVHLFQKDYTGRIYELKSDHLLYQASKMKMHICLPTMLNCIVPRSVLNIIQKRFGSIFGSIAPDFSFAFRCLETVELIIYLDMPIHMDYGLMRSTGRGCATGVLNEDYRDFLSNIDGGPIFYATPIPQLCNPANIKLHEYFIVKEQTKSPKFPDVDKKCYLESMAIATEFIENPIDRINMEKLLRDYQLEKFECEYNRASSGSSESLKMMSLMHKFRKILRSSTFKPLWRLSNCLFGIYPSGITLEFETVEDAIDYANKYPRKRRSKADYLMEDLEMADLKPK